LEFLAAMASRALSPWPEFSTHGPNEILRVRDALFVQLSHAEARCGVALVYDDDPFCARQSHGHPDQKPAAHRNNLSPRRHERKARKRPPVPIGTIRLLFDAL
jgi:hypothetical protein